MRRGSTNTYHLGRILARDATFPVAAFWANQETTGHVNISGAGVTAHSCFVGDGGALRREATAMALGA